MTDDLWCNYSDLPNVLAYEKTNNTMKIKHQVIEYVVEEDNIEYVITHVVNNENWVVKKLEQNPEHGDRNTLTPVDNKEEIIKKLKICQKNLNNLNKS